MLISTELVSDFVSLFFPTYCEGCRDSLLKGEIILCSRCLLELPQTNYHLQDDNPLKDRLALRIPIENAFAFLKFNKDGCTQRLLHSLKYQGKPEIGVALGKVFGQKLKDHQVAKSIDAIVPIPLHATRLRKRGYNQSTKFSEGLAASLDLPVWDAVVFRRKKTETQTRKTKLERWENVNEIFTVKGDESIQGKHLLLTDDVITTGSTIEACAASFLKVYDDVKISVASIAVA